MKKNRLKKKLYSLTATDFEAYARVSDGKVITKLADNIPMLSWPNGCWCIEANLYMAKLFEQGLSRSSRGGSLHTYATQISHLLRYCYGEETANYDLDSSNVIRHPKGKSRSAIDLSQFTDNDFCNFLNALIEEKNEFHMRERDENTVIAIARRCLDFLNFVGEYHHIANFLSANGRIIAEQKVAFINTRNGAHIPRKYWHHRSIPSAGAKKRRLPISSSDIRRLNEAVFEASKSIFLRKRRYLLLTLLEVTGARRSEVAALSVESVREAARMEFPALRVITKKRKSGNRERLIPIQRSVLNQLIEFIEKNRSAVIRRTCGSKNDHGLVLINETTGKGLTDNTITTELHLLRVAAGLSGRASPHMFRHTYITRLFKALAEQYCFSSKDDLRNYLFDGEKLKREVAEWTGHSNVHSLDVYIHLAFDGSNEYRNAIDIAVVRRIVDAAIRAVREMQAALNHGKENVRLSVDSFSTTLLAVSEDLDSVARIQE